jgi:hypothetical protein
MLLAVKEDESFDPAEAGVLRAPRVVFHPQQSADSGEEGRFLARHIIPFSVVCYTELFWQFNPKKDPLTLKTRKSSRENFGLCPSNMQNATPNLFGVIPC